MRLCSIYLARVAAACGLLALSACGGGGALKAAGEPCVASSECDIGLTCDFAAELPVCAGQQGQGPAPLADAPAVDAAPPPVDAPPVVDAAQPPADAPPPVDAL